MALGLASLMDSDDEYLSARSPMEEMLQQDIDELEYRHADGNIYASDQASEEALSRRPMRRRR